MYLLYGNHSALSGRVLRNLLSCRGGYASHLARNPNAANDLLIRYGVSEGSDAPTTLNRAEAIATAAHKTRALLAMDRAGVLVPKYAGPGEVDSLDPNNHTILGRSNTGSGGTDIRVYRPGEPRAVHQLYTQFVPSVREMRIHVFQGEMIHAQIKQYRGDGEAPTHPIRNHSRGWVFVPYVRTRPNQDRIDAAVAAVEALGLDFGAVDLLVGDDGRSYVLEVNTGPGLTPRTALAYARAFEGWCNAHNVRVTLNTEDLELDTEEEACYTDSGGATSAPVEPTPTPTVADSTGGSAGQDRGTTDEREALRSLRADRARLLDEQIEFRQRIAELEAEVQRLTGREADFIVALENERTISDERRRRLLAARNYMNTQLGEV